MDEFEEKKTIRFRLLEVSKIALNHYHGKNYNQIMAENNIYFLNKFDVLKAQYCSFKLFKMDSEYISLI